ncbi:MAG: UDP-N-acetylmuramoyl-L-alanyl-D-glutamate--2,6-diaminopimelate ligase, partial [Desulfovibrionaceae bacterium]|nr:UDP-N-acetylmuramoyl-L-alanyl-D-glutamate--2,6-diaminopimelate ligase [Desulfovibrionaceae bacterium]
PEALGRLAKAFFNTEESSLKLVGVTGTNGKTTVSYLVEHLLAASGLKVGVLGTVSYRWPGFSLNAKLTTPGCWMLHELLFNMEQSDVDAVVMEVSSHALDQNRVAGLAFDAAVLTNLTQDHLDYHKDMESYFRAKERLFRHCPKPDKTWIVNFNDPFGRRLLSNGRDQVLGFGLGEAGLGEVPVMQGEIVSSSARGLVLKTAYKGKTWEVESGLIGAHNASNILAAQAVAFSLGLNCRNTKRISEFKGVPGRLERVENPHGLDIFVDYAHTPDALANVQRSLRDITAKRLIVVFGCGGDRDRTKRPLMGQAVADYADVAVLTSDNPRHEDPLKIMAQARPGLTSSPRSGSMRIVEEPDRYAALVLAVGLMEPGDVLLVAGKGHETYQQIGDEFLPFSDVSALNRALEETR